MLLCPKSILTAILLVFVPSLFSQPFIVIPPGDTTALKSHLSSKSNCVLLLQGSFTINETLLVDAKKNLTINGNGATWNVGSKFRLRIMNSDRIRIENLRIVDTSGSASENPLFDFIGCFNSGLEGISYSATNPLRNPVWIRTGSKRGYVKNCDFSSVSIGIRLGDQESEFKEPIDDPTSDCLIENNRISKFESEGIITRARSNVYNPNDPSSRLRHVIRGNFLELPNNNGTEDKNSVGIEIWGSECTVEGNTILANPNLNRRSRMGISLAGAFRIQCLRNKIIGAFRYQGIEVASSENSLISENIIEGVAGLYGDIDSVNTAGIGLSRKNDTSAYSSNNIISKNQIIGCMRGLNVAVFSSGTKVIGNAISNSMEYGIYSMGAGFEASENRFSGNKIDLYHMGGNREDDPIRISGNLFEKTLSAVFLNENDSPDGRPFIFENNTVSDWGDAKYPEALILRCGTSVIKNNVFRNTRTSGSGWPIPLMVATKSYSYGQIQHVFDGNTLVGVPLSFTDIKGDRVGVNLRYGSYANYDLASMGDSKEIMEIENALAPTNSRVLGAWASGDKIHIRNPVVGGYRGYVCVYAADTCSWKGFGKVEP